MLTVYTPESGYKRTARIPLTFTAADTVASFTMGGKGHIHSYYLETSNTTGNGTHTVTFENVESNEIYNSGAKVENAEYMITGIDLILAEIITIKSTLSAPAGTGGGTDYITLYLK